MSRKAYSVESESASAVFVILANHSQEKPTGQISVRTRSAELVPKVAL